MNVKKIARTLARDCEGSAAVELVMAAPIFLLLLFGIIQFGFIFFVWNDMANAAREGARRLAVDDTLTEDQAKTVVENWLVNWPATFTVTACNISTESDDPATCTGDDEVFVVVTAPMSEIAMIGNLFNVFGVKTMTASVTMRKEG